MSCPAFDELLAARAEPVAHGEVFAHVGGCPRCALAWAALLRLEAAPAAARWPDVPQRLASAARELVRVPARALRDASAQLLFDSAVAGSRPALALRGAGPATRHLAYEAGALHLELAVLAGEHAGGDTLVGQFAGVRDPSSACCVLTGADVARWTPLERNGDFRFERVRPGRWLLALEAEDQRLVLPALELSAPVARDPLH
jgi:hypothetical protein